MQSHRFITAVARAATMGKLRTPSMTVGVSHISTRYLSSSPLDAFRDPVDRQIRGSEQVGRPWSVKALRRKSYDDLHKLWYVLYIERNMLLTEQQLSRRRKLIFPQPERFQKVKKSMGAIKQVLGERKKVKIAEFKLTKMEEEMTANAEDDMDVEIDIKQT
jgi:large subunit ribosomal protein L47